MSHDEEIQQMKDELKQIVRDKAFTNLQKATKAMEKIDEEDCPEDLVNLAKSPFERALCVEFIKFVKEQATWKTEVTSNANWQKVISLAIFGAVVVGIIMRVI